MLPQKLQKFHTHTKGLAGMFFVLIVSFQSQRQALLWRRHATVVQYMHQFLRWLRLWSMGFGRATGVNRGSPSPIAACLQEPEEDEIVEQGRSSHECKRRNELQLPQIKNEISTYIDHIANFALLWPASRLQSTRVAPWPSSTVRQRLWEHREKAKEEKTQKVRSTMMRHYSLITQKPKSVK